MKRTAKYFGREFCGLRRRLCRRLSARRGRRSKKAQHEKMLDEAIRAFQKRGLCATVPRTPFAFDSLIKGVRPI